MTTLRVAFLFALILFSNFSLAGRGSAIPRVPIIATDSPGVGRPYHPVEISREPLASTTISKEPSENKAKGMLESLSQDGRTAVSVDAEGEQGRYSKLNVKIANNGNITTTSIDIPRWEFFKLEKALIQKRMAKAFAHIPADSPIFFTSLPPGISSSDLLPGRITVRTFDNSPRFIEDHVLNLENLKNAKLNPKDTKFFNFVAPPPGSAVLAEKRWTSLRQHYDDVAGDLGVQFGSSKTELLKNLSDGDTDVVVVVAHGDQSSIHLPDGSSITVSDIMDISPISNSNNRPPIIVLLSCETGSSNRYGMTTIAEALMLRGRASAIIAPTRQVSAGRKTTEILNQIIQSAEEGEFFHFMKRTRGPWQVIVEATTSYTLSPL